MEITVEATRVRDKAKGMLEVVFDELSTASHSGDDDNAPFLSSLIPVNPPSFLQLLQNTYLSLELLHTSDFHAVRETSQRVTDLETLCVVWCDNANVLVSCSGILALP